MPYNISRSERYQQLQACLDIIAKSSLMVTDRLHGVIFAAITGTPCIAISNNNHKILGIYQWLQAYQWIRYCQDVYEFNEILSEIQQIDCKECQINMNDDFIPLLNVFKEIIK